MKKLLAFLFFLLAPLAAQGQTTTTMYRVDTIAALKAIPTSRPPVVIVMDIATGGEFAWGTTPCSAADDVYQVTPTAGPTGCWTRMSTPYATGTDSTISVATVAALKALTTRPASVTTLGYYAANDGGGGPVWTWVAGSATAADDCTVVAPTSGAAGRWKRNLAAGANVRWCGAYGTATLVEPSAVSIASGLVALTVAGGVFSASDVGKKIRVPGAGVAGGLLSTTIATYVSGTQVTVSNAAGTTLAAVSKPIVYGYDDTAAIQATMTASQVSRFPCGTYFVTSTLTLPANKAMEGSTDGCVILARTDAYEHTVTAGVAGVGGAGTVSVTGIWFLTPQYFTYGTTTTLPFAAASATAAHLALYGADGATVTNNRFWYNPNGVSMYGGTQSTISNNYFTGVWDTTNANTQEGISGITMKKDGSNTVKSVVVSGNKAFGGPSSSVESINYTTATCGTVAKSLNRNIGTKYGILATDGEDVYVNDNYFGGNSFNAILLSVENVMQEWKVKSNFFDSSPNTGYAVKLTTTGIGLSVLDAQISGNVFNGQLNGGGALYVDYPTSLVSADNLQFSDNTVYAHVMTPVVVLGTSGAVMSGNIITAFNVLDVCSTDPLYASGIYVSGPGVVNSSSNSIGGGTYPQWGIYAGTSNIYRSSSDVNVGLVTAMYGGSSSNLVTQSIGQTITGALAATTFNGNTITASTGTLSLFAGSTLGTSGAYGITFTSTGATSVTVPTAGTLATLAGSEALTNKTYNGNTWTAGTGTLSLFAGSTLATSGAYGITFTATGATSVTVPTGGTLATLAGSEAFTNKTYNGNTWTAGTGTLTIAASKTLTASNTLTLTATDGSTLAIGTGGTLGSNAYTSTSYAPIASPTFTGTATIPVITSATSITATGYVSVTSADTAKANLASITASDTNNGAPGSTLNDNKYTILAGSTTTGLVASYNSSTNIAYLFALQPGVAWRTISINPSGPTTVNTLNVTTMASTAQTNAVCYNTSTGLTTYQTWATGCLASSARFKENITVRSNADALKVVTALEPVTFTYKKSADMGSEKHNGFIAEQVVKVAPDLVDFEKDGKTPRAVKYQELAPYFAGAIRELKAANDNLKAEIEQLKKKVK